MAKIITITDGVGSDTIANGTYSALANVEGYNNESLNPSSLTVTSGTNEYAFTIAATGTLTLHVTEDGTSTGTPVIGASFFRTDATGTTYGDAVVTDTNGDAILDNVPYGTNAPTIYYKQTASDGSHEFSTDVLNITMTTQTETVEITNALAATRTISLTDANYQNLPISGTITLS